MAQIENTATMRKGRSFSHNNKKHMLRIDMTPMVDLGFLLITFFVFTTTMSTPKATDLFMPKDDINHPQPLPNSLALSLLLDDNNKVFYYSGDFKEAVSENKIGETNYSAYEGIGKIIRQKQKDLDDSGKFTDGRKGLMLLIKPTSKSVYDNVIDALDEAVINDVRKYAIVEPIKEEIDYIKTKHH
ncbi:MAG TPA: biopolymer transporter ExbD [Chitinophagaceae bacterium]